MKKEAGYVYILTNPSFKEDWVKIGKSSRPVDVRSKELDNTAVPMPFEIYATLKTSKYEEVEKLIHKTIDRLTDLRIRRNGRSSTYLLLKRWTTCATYRPRSTMPRLTKFILRIRKRRRRSPPRTGRNELVSSSAWFIFRLEQLWFSCRPELK